MGESSPPTGSSSIRVLLVDDEPDILTTAEMILEKNGFHVETAPSVGEAARLLAEKPFDVIVSDYQMPGKDGLQFLKELRERGDATPFIVLTGRGREEVAIRALNLGADRYLQKGVDIEAMYAELTDAIKRCGKSKQAEAALQESEARYRTAFETTGTATIIVEEDTTISMMNTEFEKLSDYSKEEVEGKKSWIEFVTKDYLEKMKGYHRLRRVDPNTAPRTYEFQFINRQGNVRNVLLNIAMIPGTKKSIASILDITDRKQAEEKLRESEERYRLISENTSDYIAVTTFDLNLTYTYVSPSLIQDFGYKPEELLGKSAWPLIHPDDKKKLLSLLRKYVTAKIKKLLTGKESEIFERVEYRFRRKSGEWRYLETTANIVKGSLLFISRDNTERKQAETALRESEERYRSIFETAASLILLVDEEGVILDCNRQTEQFLGYTRDELTGQSIAKIYHSDYIAKAQASLKEIFNKGFLYNHQKRMVRKDGTVVDVNINSAALRDNKGEYTQTVCIFDDITERKQAEETLRESEERYRVLVESSPNLVGIYQDGVLKYVNKAMRTRLDWTFEELTSPSFNMVEKLVPQSLQATVKDHLAKKLLGEHIRPHEFNVKTRDGSESPVMAHNERITYHGKPAIEILLVDITERKRAEEALKESEWRYRSFFKTSRDCVFLTSKEGEWLDVNNVGAEIFGYMSREEFMKTKVQAIYANPEAREKLLKRIDEQGFAENYPYDFQKRDGTIIKTLVTVLSRRDEKGAVVGYQGTIRDITEMKRAQQALEEAEERLRALVDHLYEGLYTLDAANNITFANPQFAAMLGYQPEELIGKYVFNYFPEEEVGRVEEMLEKRRKGISSRYELPWKTKEGGRVPTIISASPLFRDGRYVGSDVVVTDLTERKRLEEETLKAMEMVARSIGHDVRNPLSAIRTAAYVLKDAEGEKRREMLAMIERNVVAADRTLLNLRDLTAVPTLKLAEADINGILRGVAAQAVLLGGVKLTASYGDLPRVEVDGGQLSRVFGNLVKNAVEAMPEGGKLEVSTGVADRYIEVKVSDTGVGIPEENLGKLFTPFFTTKEKGTGLGLVGVKHIVESHGGVIKVESTVGKSTTFTVQIPRKSEG